MNLPLNNMTPSETPKTAHEEAVELFELIGLDPNSEPRTEQEEFLRLLPSYINTEDLNQNNPEEKLHWTRLSINSNIGCVVD